MPDAYTAVATETDGLTFDGTNAADIATMIGLPVEQKARYNGAPTVLVIAVTPDHVLVAHDGDTVVLKDGVVAVLTPAQLTAGYDVVP